MDFDKYRINNVPYVSHKTNPEGHAAYQAEESRLCKLFHDDALAEAGLTGHPKAEKAFELAWSLGHAYGYSEVMGYLYQIAEVVL
jgi:hypothetical protein